MSRYRRLAFPALLSLSLVPQPVRPAVLYGTVVDTSGEPVEGAHVFALPDGKGPPAAGAIADGRGHFRMGELAGGSYVVAAWRIGLERFRSATIRLGDPDSLFLPITLAPTAIRLNPTVVSASRRHEKSLEAPASLSVVGRNALAERPVVTPTAHVRTVPGLDVASKGLTQSSVVARGFNSQQSTALLALTDYRVTSLPSLRYNLFHFVATPSEDMERIEVLRGPAAAVYGPNSDRGVLHIITRSPLDAPGTAVSVIGGERQVLHGSLRHASRLGDGWGLRISGQALRGNEWPDRDPVEEANRSAALAAGADPDTLRIGARREGNDRVAGEARLDWRHPSGTTLVAAAGVNRALEQIEVTAVGAAQVVDWTSSYIQVRAARGTLFAQAFVNASDAGDTYFLRTGSPIVDESRFWAAQIQHGARPWSPLLLTYGLDAQWTEPRTGGTIMGRNEGEDGVRELGAYLHAEGNLSGSLDGVAAVRVDDHSRFQDPVASPRAGLVWKPGSDQNLRLTYNRAFGTPATDDLFADLLVDSVPGLPLGIRVSGVPESGFTFHRQQDGLPSMRSPFTPESEGGPWAYLPPDATLLWPAVVAIMQAQGVDLTGIPPPTSADVQSDWRVLNRDGSFERVTTVPDLPALRPTITNSVELGYRGLIGGRVRLSAEVYRTWVENFIGHLHTITPNVFLERTTLADYLQAQGRADAEALADTITGIPLGTISPTQARDPADLILAVRNFGSVALWGADISILAEIGERISLVGTFSWVSEDLFRGLDSVADVALNAPARKGTVTAAFRDPGRGCWLELRVRIVDSFPVISGVYAGEIPSYSLLDAGAGFRLSRQPATTLTLTAENVLDRRHREFLGAPELGRLILARVGAEF